MTTNMNDYILEDHDELRTNLRNTTESQFENDFYNKSFTNQLKSDETDT